MPKRTYIKLVDKDLRSRHGYQWIIGKTHRANGSRSQGLCSSEYLHVYRSIGLACLMASYHGIGHYTRALEVEGVEHVTDGTKSGLRQCKVVRAITLPTMSTEQRVAIAILCASAVYSHRKWKKWARSWLSGDDRSRGAADAAYTAAAAYAAYTAAAAAAYAANAADAADAAANAAVHAANAAAAVHAAYAADDNAVDVSGICELVLTTKESQWDSLLSLEEE